MAAHAIGHWLGLYHTVEEDGTTLDPIADTPTCACGRCPDPNQPCGAEKNLMYWDLAATGTALTSQQGAVMRSNPLVR